MANSLVSHSRIERAQAAPPTEEPAPFRVRLYREDCRQGWDFTSAAEVEGALADGWQDVPLQPPPAPPNVADRPETLIDIVSRLTKLEAIVDGILCPKRAPKSRK